MIEQSFGPVTYRFVGISRTADRPAPGRARYADSEVAAQDSRPERCQASGASAAGPAIPAAHRPGDNPAPAPGMHANRTRRNR